MKKKSGSFLLCLSFISFWGKAQSPSYDTVSLGSGYANQVWYSLANDNQASQSKTAWDLAFDVSNYGSTIRINSVAGVALYNWPNGDLSNWDNVDTLGITTWTKRFDSDTNWTIGAFSAYPDPNNQFDVDWGIYNVNTHIISGDSIYIIKLQNGSFKKLAILNLSNGIFNFKYANLDGSESQNKSIIKSDFSGKNFAYFSFSSAETSNPEPANSNWDLLFTQYSTLIPGQGAYPVSGVLANQGVQIAKAYPIADPNSFSDYSMQNYQTAMNTIGYDWKSFNGSGYAINDSLVFFIQSVDGSIWKLIMTGFGGSANGNFLFNKELLSSTGINASQGERAWFLVYPNPSQGNCSLFYSNLDETSITEIVIQDETGRITYQRSILGNTELNVEEIPCQNWSSGTYFLTMKGSKTIKTQKFVLIK